MPGEMAKIPTKGRNLDKIVRYSDEPENATDLIFGFLDEVFESSEDSCNSNLGFRSAFEDEEEEDESATNEEQNKAFWESQEQLLLATLCRTTSLESKIRQATKYALEELNSDGFSCFCLRPVPDRCRKCMQKEVCNRLKIAGFNSAICKSKWKSSPDIPSGEHTYMEVVQTSGSKKGKVKVIIELNFRGEFVMARASDEYNRLINKLPEVYVGKIERLRALVKILCSASKKCIKDKKMYMAPWRKHKYMEAKWLGNPESKPAAIFPAEILERAPPPRPRASMLTFDLGEKIQSMHCTAIRVV